MEPPELAPGVRIVARKGRGRARPSTPDEDQHLEEGRSTPEGRELLERLHGEERHLRCLCGWRLHVRQGQTRYSLVMNRGERQKQQEAGTSCWLCVRSEGWTPPLPPETPRPHPEPENTEGLILRIPTITDPQDGSDAEWAAWAASSGVEPASVRTRMERWMVDAGWHELAGPVPEPALWTGMDEVLMRHPIPVGEGALALYPRQLTWTPSGLHRGGLQSFAHQVRRQWPGGARYRCEVWALCLVEDDGVRIGNSTSTLEVIDVHGLAHTVTVPTDIMPGITRGSRLWMRGPYLILLAGAPHWRTHALEWYRMGITGVASRCSPVPVDSGHERGVVGMLQDRGNPYTKPVVPDADGLLPDIILRGERWAMLEVQGRSDPAYRERKARMHIRMREVARARGWEFLRYDPYRGETLHDLSRRLTEHGF